MDGIFVYGLLHDPAYCEDCAPDLKKILPHIPPTPETRERRSVSPLTYNLVGFLGRG